MGSSSSMLGTNENETLRLIKQQLGDCSSPNERDEFCAKAAQFAAKHCQPTAVRFLVEKTSEQAGARDRCCLEAAESAAVNGHWELARHLADAIADTAEKDRCCTKVAEYAASSDKLEVVKALLEMIAEQRDKDVCCSEAANSAAISGYYETMQCLVVSIFNQKVKDQCCAKAAQAVANNGHWDRLNFLVESIAEQRAKDACCKKAVESAIRFRAWEAVKFLLGNIFDTDMRDQGCMKAAESACVSGEWDIVKYMVQSIGHQTVKDQCCRKTAAYAAKGNLLQLAEFLVLGICDSKVRGLCRLEAAEQAAWNGHVEVVDLLLRTTLEQGALDECRSRAAISAARNNQWDVVKFLLPSMADQCIKDRCCLAMVECAARSQNWRLAKHLVRSVTDESVKNECCMKAVESAATCNEWGLVKFLLQNVTDQSVRNIFCRKAAESAIISHEWQMVKLMIHSATDHAVKLHCSLKALERAAKNGQQKALEVLLQTVVDESMRDQCCIKAAEWAANSGQLPVVKVLLKMVLQDDVRGEILRRCVVASSSSCKEEIVEFFGIQPDWIFLHPQLIGFLSTLAICNRNAILFRTLNLMQSSQVTKLLRLAIVSGHVALALALMPQVSQVDLSDSSGSTALMLASDKGHQEVIASLLDAGASVQAEDSQGRTALSRACQAGHVRATKALIDRGADSSHTDRCGLTCGQLAEKFGHSQVLLLLLPSPAMQCTTDASMELKLPTPEKQICKQDDTEHDEQLSQELSHLLRQAGFTRERVECQQEMAELVQGMARALTQEDRRMIGSYADGWGSNLAQANGRTLADSDIDWTVLVAGETLHLEAGCVNGRRECAKATKLKVADGRVQAVDGLGGQAVVTAPALGVRPTQDTCHALPCCSEFRDARIGALSSHHPIHLVWSTRRKATARELQTSFSFQEIDIMRSLSTVQGQLFIVIKFIFKRLLTATLNTPGLTSYHAKTLLLYVLEKHGIKSERWKPDNLIALVKEALDMMLRFIDSSGSPDECMPHFFIPSFPLYFKNAGIGGEFDKTKNRVRDQLSELKSDPDKVVEQVKRYIRPLHSEKIFFHPFTLLPLSPPPSVTEVREGSATYNWCERYSDAYSVINQYLSDLQSESVEQDTLMSHRSLLQELPWCRCASLCLNAMTHLKFGDSNKAVSQAEKLQHHSLQNCWSPSSFPNRKYETWEAAIDSDWAWRFCFPCTSQPRFRFLPEFTQTLFTARMSQPRSAHLYVNFRCLSWSLQAELLKDGAATLESLCSSWFAELHEDPDLEELLTLAHYSGCRKHLRFCANQMERIRDEKRVAMETQDEDKIRRVRECLVDELASVTRL